MPATTRSSTRSYYAAAAAIHAAATGSNPVYVLHPGGQGQTITFDLTPRNNNKKWTTADERTLIRMCRHTEMTPAIMAATLGRSEESIRYRLARLIHEHLDGRTDEASIREVSDWLLPN
jgi:hypothetical protein